MILNIATTVCIGLMIGTEFAVSAFINPAQWKLEDRAQMDAIRLFAAKLGSVMPFWYGLGLLLLLAETFVLRHQSHVLMLGLASGLWATVIILTVLFLVPINNRLARFDNTAATEKAQREHRKWDTLHRLRVLALTSAMVMFLAAVNH
jgi:uncharacterized membrane protein